MSPTLEQGQTLVVTPHETPPRQPEKPERPVSMGWKELYLKEDWWAVWIGVGMMLAAIILFKSGSPLLKAIAINPGGLNWTSFSQVAAYYAHNAQLYLLQFIFWLAVFGISGRIMGLKLSQFAPSFLFVYVLSVIMFTISGWAHAAEFNLEPPLVALVVGLILANVVRLPKWMDTGFRTEFFIKLGIILLGCSFPITLVLTAGPVAIFQATIISLITCLIIYFIGTKVFKLDRRMCAVLGVGGAVCGVSAAMAISASVEAKKKDLYPVVTMVVGWALVMILVMPFVARAMHLVAGVAGAWIGTSEFADAAGIAAASAYGKMVGNESAALQGFTLMKVIGRDLWIGIWSFVWALIATMRWDKEETGSKPNVMEIWYRFPKFVLGFFFASLLITAFTSGYSPAILNSVVKPGLVLPLASLRTWAFVFCFLSIGLTTRFRDLQGVGWKTFWAFSIGAAVNVVLGFVLSVYVFAQYWARL